MADNEPYDGALKNDTMYRHATQRGLSQALLELRQDLVADEAGVLEWADRLEPILRDLSESQECRQVRYFKSRCD